MEQINKNQSLYKVMLDSAKIHSKNKALWYMNRNYSYAHLLDKTNRVANKLIELGFKNDDVITVCLPNMPIAVYLLYAINQIGGVANLVHPLMGYQELEKIMNVTKSKILFCLDTNYSKFSPFIEKGIEVIPCSPVEESPLYIQIVYKIQNKKELKFNAKNYSKDFINSKPYTNYEIDYLKDSFYLHSGGTTGNSKTIALSSFSLNALAAQGIDILGVNDATKYHMFAVLPMFHGFGLCMGIHAMIAHGGADTLMPKFHSNQTIKLIKKNMLSFLIGVPILYEALLRNKKFTGKKLKNLYIAFVGGDFVAKSLLERFNQRMEENGSICRLYEGYGLTETVTVCSVNTHQNHRDGTVGQTFANTKAKAVDLNTGKDLPADEDGELYISGETLMNGYRFDKDAVDPFVVDKDGIKWVRTGDFGSVSKDNYISFKQRLKRIVKVNGINVFPSDIENVVASLEEVFECAAIGINDDKRGSMIKLFVTLDRRFEGKNYDDKINNIIKEKCGVYAVPKEIVYMDKMPKTLVGKIDTKLLH